MHVVVVLAVRPASPQAVPSHQWSQRFGGTGTDNGYAIAVDATGAVFVTGSFSGTANFGGADLVSVGGNDIFLARYDANGQHLWSKGFGTVENDEGLAVGVDGLGNVVVTGRFWGTIDFGGGSMVSDYIDAFVAKLAPNGTHIWSTRLGGPGAVVGQGIAVDGSGNIVVAGTFEGDADFGGGSVASVFEDMFVAKLGADGTYLWSLSDTGSFTDKAYAVAVDGADNIYVTGSFSDNMHFDANYYYTQGLDDIYLAKYDTNGTHLWFAQFGGADKDAGYALALDNADNAVVGGVFGLTAHFGADSLVSAGLTDGFVVRVAPGGSIVSSRRIGSTLLDEVDGLATDALGNVYAAGYFQGMVDFGGGVISSAGNRDGFLAAYDAADAHVWSRGLGGTSLDVANAVAVDVDGNMFAAGNFRLTANFGGDDLTSAGNPDVFVGKYGETPSGVASSPSIDVLSIDAYPNPFNPETTLRFTLPSNGRVKIAIYDARGALVAAIIDEVRPAGVNVARWNGREASGHGAASSVYFARIEYNGATRSHKLVLLK